jgi:hypothetical protein
MKQPHKNLFFSYRGARREVEETDLLVEKQLEDNVTKALIYVLENCDRDTVLTPFLRTVGITQKVRLAEVQFLLQRVDIARPTIRQRIALAIAPDPEIDESRAAPHDAGRPDAWIWADESFAILVETKVRGAVSRHQLDRHVRGAEGWTSGQTRMVSLSWPQLYDLFAEIRRSSSTSDPVTRLLLDQFVRYLRMTALASDTTFDLDDFGYFLLRAADRDSATRTLLHRKLVRFTEELTRSSGLKRMIAQYGVASRTAEAVVSPGLFRKDSTNYWITIGPKDRRDRCHFTVRLTERGISLEAFSPHKSFTRKLLSRIERNPAEFLMSLRRITIDQPVVIRLREAYFHNPASSYKGQRIDRKVDYLEVHPSVLTSDNLETLILDPVRTRLKYNHLRPEVFLLRHFGLSEVIGNSSVVQDVSYAAELMLDYFNFALTA